MAPSGTWSSSSTNTAPRLLELGHHAGVVHDLLAHVDRRRPAVRARARRSRWPARRRRRTTAARPAAPGVARRPPPSVRPRARRRAARAARPAPPETMPATGWTGVSDTALITATGRSPAAAASGADSMSASSVPSAASPARSDRRTRWSTVVIRPVRAVSPARRSSPASSGADGQVVTPTSVPTTRSPGPRSEVSPAPTPITTIWPNGLAFSSPARSAALVVP